MSTMFIKNHGHNTLYCTNHNGRDMICAVEILGELTKWYYPNADILQGTMLDFRTLAAFSELQKNSIAGDDIDNVVFSCDNSLPSVVFSVDSMLAWIDKNKDEVLSSIYLFEDMHVDVPRLLVDLTVISKHVLRHYLEHDPLPIYRIPPALQPAYTREEEARAHIENKEFLVPVYRLGDAAVIEAHHKVSMHINKIREEGFGCFPSV